MSGRVTDHQQRCWDALNEHRGAVPASKALGVDVANLRLGVKAYMRNMGIEGKPPFTAPYVRRRPTPTMLAQQAAAELLAEKDATIARLAQRVDELEALAAPWVAVHRKLDALLARPAGVTSITHRRQADGGVGGRAERKAAGGRR